MQFPESREALRRDLEYELREQLQADEGEPVKQLLRRHAPRYDGKGRPILWLDWGVFGPRSGQQASLNSSQLGEWLDFTSSFLRQHCPDDIRIVCSLAFELEKSKHQRLERALMNHHRQLDDRAFWLRILEPVGSVAEHELLDFLKDDRTGCSVNRSEMAERLIHETGGVFESLVALIEEAEQTSWGALLDCLKRKQGKVTPEDDELF